MFGFLYSVFLKLLYPTTIALVLLIGEMPYYGRFGFQPVPPGQIALPGPVDPARLLAAELVPGALAGAVGVVKGYAR